MKHARVVREIYRITLSILMLVLTSSTLSADELYSEPQVYGMRPGPKNEWNLGPIGATGIEARFYKGLKLTVESVDPDSPADGKFTKGDVILAINGNTLPGSNPLVVLGEALTEAEAKDGKLVFQIEPIKKGAPDRVTIQIPILGAYSKTFPLKCEKSKKIISQAAKFYAGADRLKAYNMWNALACMFLLSTGDDQYVPRVKEYFAQFLTPEGEVKGIGNHSWFNGYNGIACAEYYLRTGDKDVLPILQYLCDDARDRQRYGVGWGHWGFNANPAYESGGGMQHAAGTQILMTLVLGKMCGVEVDEKTLLGAMRHWYRFAGHGAIPIADQRYWHIFRGAGRDGASAAIMHVASQAEGDVTIYKKAKEYLAMSALTSWPARSYDWEVYWHSLAGQFMLEYDPDLYHQTMHRFRWRYDLGRYANGGFAWAHNAGTKNASEAGIALALAYTAPLKKLCITGAPRSEHAVDFTMPEQLWGNETDLAFLTSKHNKDYYKYGKDEEIHIPYWQLPTQLRYGPETVKDLSLKMLQKNVRHARCEIRMGAAKGLCMNGHYAELEKLLTDPDPRLRRAALDGINDCRPWFTGVPVGKNALPAEKFTPAMKASITKILSDPNEAWFVTDAALQSLYHAPVDLIQANLGNIRNWTTRNDWWMRESAFLALMGLRTDDKLFAKQLPNICQMMIDEYNYNPRHKMVKELERALETSEKGSEVRGLIIAGFQRAAVETKVLPDVGQYTRSKEGLVNILESAQALMAQAPECSADIAVVLTQGDLLTTMKTEYLMKIIHEHGKHAKGFYPALEGLDDKRKEQLTEVLYNEYRPELIRRHQASDKPDGKLIDMILELTELKQDVPGWEPIGAPGLGSRVWRYRTYDPPEDEQLHPRIGPPKRMRSTTLSKDMGNWFMPDFDDSKWKSGEAPIGKGVFKAHGHGRGHVPDPEFYYQNSSDWGKGEFIAARTSFELTDADLKKDYFRLRVLCPQGYHIYLNGKKIHSYAWFHNTPSYFQRMLGPDQIKHLRKGTNTLAVRSVVKYSQDRETGKYSEMAQIDVYIDALDKKDIGL